MLWKNIAKLLLPQGIKSRIRQFLGIKEMTGLDSLYIYPDNWISQRKFYGQYGEDLKLLPFFQNQRDGYFVEVGALEGIRFSNTYYFERLGWKGICVEPHPDYTDLLKNNCPGSIVVQAAVGKEDKKEVDFYINYRGSLSTLDRGLESYFRLHYKPWFGGFKKIQVPLLTLNTILEQNRAPIPIDLISIDTEGTDADVLAGFDIGKYLPRVMVVEVSIRRELIDEYMSKHGYVLACANPSNAIFCRNQHDADIIRSINVVGTQCASRHPLDN
ncbi:MAG: FkbM family methyltransferase [Patescibacteria group bacterium]